MEIFVDIETQSTADLAGLGARRYICHPSTRLMMLVAKVQPAGQLLVWIPHLPRKMLLEMTVPSSVTAVTGGSRVPQWLRSATQYASRWIGHNCDNFDGPFLAHHYDLRPDWYDTMPAARAAGLPAGLDALGEALGGEGKDKQGKAVMRLLCQAKLGPGGFEYHEGTVHLWQKLLTYNIRDVELTEQVYREVRGRGYEEPEVVRVDRAINERGVYVDTRWLKDLLLLWDHLEAVGGDRLSSLTGGALNRDNAASVSKVKQWLALQAVQLPTTAAGKTTLNRKTLEAIYEAPEETLGECDDAALIVEVLKLRQSMTRAMKKKLARITDSLDPDARARDWSVYHGAHTGRFTSRRIQLHNMARGVPVDVEAIINGPRTLEHVRAVAGDADVDDVLATLVRPVFTASPGHVLGICDYNAVEARGVAWLANEQKLLDAFNDPTRDVYCEFGSRVFGRAITKKDKAERGIAKICVLGMGYGMGVNKFGLYAEQSGIDLPSCGVVTLTTIAEWRALGVSFNPDKDTLKRWEADGYRHVTQREIVARVLVKQYRETYPNIVAMWREVGAQAEVARRHGEGSACMGRVRFHTHGSAHLYLTLPGGRVLTYRHCRIERRVPAYCLALGLAPFEKDTLVYSTPRGYDSTLFGSKLVENIVQAFCRDFLTDALVQLEDLSMLPVLHVHDEVVCEIPAPVALAGLQTMGRIMSTPPAWAEGFPLRVEGFTCPRYCKTPWKQSMQVDYINGRVA